MVAECLLLLASICRILHFMKLLRFEPDWKDCLKFKFGKFWLEYLHRSLNNDRFQWHFLSTQLG